MGHILFVIKLACVLLFHGDIYVQINEPRNRREKQMHQTMNALPNQPFIITIQIVQDSARTRRSSQDRISSTSIKAESCGKLLILRYVSRGLRLDQLFWHILILHKFALADMLGCPYFVGERTTLTLGVFVRTTWVHAGVKLAGSLDMRELASFGRAAGTVAAKWHVRVLKMAMRVGAMGEESAHLLGLMCRLDRW